MQSFASQLCLPTTDSFIYPSEKQPSLWAMPLPKFRTFSIVFAPFSIEHTSMISMWSDSVSFTNYNDKITWYFTIQSLFVCLFIPDAHHVGSSKQLQEAADWFNKEISGTGSVICSFFFCWQSAWLWLIGALILDSVWKLIAASHDKSLWTPNYLISTRRCCS